MTREIESVLIAARTLPPEELPFLLGDLEVIRATALARLKLPSQAPAQPDELLDVRKAADRLGISKEYLYRHHSSFDFTRHVGRRLLFSAQGIQDYVRCGSVLGEKRAGQARRTLH